MKDGQCTLAKRGRGWEEGFGREERMPKRQELWTMKRRCRCEMARAEGGWEERMDEEWRERMQSVQRGEGGARAHQTVKIRVQCKMKLARLPDANGRRNGCSSL